MSSVSLLLRKVSSLLGAGVESVNSDFLIKVLWYVVALTATTGRRTVRRMQAAMPFAPSDRHGIERLLKDEPSAARELLRQLGHRRLLRALGRKRRPRVFLALDTTNHQRFGRKMEGAFRFRDNSTSGFIRGHRVVVLVAVVGRQIIPLGGRLFVRKEDAPAVGVEFKSQIDLAEELLRAVPLMPKDVTLEVLADSFFFNTQIVKACRELGFVLTSRAHVTQTVTGPGPGRRTTVGRRMARIFANRQAKPVQVRQRGRVRTYLVARRIQSFRKIGTINTIFSRERGKKKDPVAIVTTDIDATPRQVLERMGHRWAIELFFRSCKQDLGMGHYQGRHWEGVDHHLQLVLMAHLLLSCTADKSRDRVEKHHKRETLSGLQDLRAGRARLHEALFEDLTRGARTRQAVINACKAHAQAVFGP